MLMASCSKWGAWGSYWGSLTTRQCLQEASSLLSSRKTIVCVPLVSETLRQNGYTQVISQSSSQDYTRLQVLQRPSTKVGRLALCLPISPIFPLLAHDTPTSVPSELSFICSCVPYLHLLSSRSGIFLSPFVPDAVDVVLVAFMHLNPLLLRQCPWG